MKKLFNLCIAALALLLCLGALPARAATYVVSNLNSNGTGSLNNAIENALSTPDDDTITFSISGTILTGTGLFFSRPPLRDSGALVIDGTGQHITIQGADDRWVLLVTGRANPNWKLTLKALTFANSASGIRPVLDVGFIDLQLVDCVFSGNSSQEAIVATSNGNVEVTNTVFSDNTVSGNAVLYVRAAPTNLTVTNSRFTRNVGAGAAEATAILSQSNTTITNSSFESNIGQGPAVLARRLGEAKNKLTVMGSTFNGNTATGSLSKAGAMYIDRMPATIINSTFHANESSAPSNGSAAGAILAAGFSTTEWLFTVTNSTFSGNKSAGGAAIYVDGNPLLTLRNTIIANSTGNNCSAGVVDGGGNLSDDMSCNFTAASSLNRTAAQLGPLADNGGPTKTMMPLTGSPAIDQGVNTLALDADGVALTTDQRGSPRISPIGGTVDRGAVELLVIPPPVLTTCPAATAQVGVTYNSALGATGGKAPNRFAFTGSLPRGLALGAATGTLTGMPIKPGSYAFTATVTDSASPTPRSSSKACTITVAEAANRGPLIVTPTRLHYAPVPLPAVLMKQTVTLTHIGNPGSPPVKGGGTPVQLGPISVTPDPGTAPDAFTLLNPCPAVLYVGQSCTIVVVGPARPTTPLSATLNIPNNAPASPQTVALSAGAAP